jgi:hypothetical protein
MSMVDNAESGITFKVGQIWTLSMVGTRSDVTETEKLRAPAPTFQAAIDRLRRAVQKIRQLGLAPEALPPEVTMSTRRHRRNLNERGMSCATRSSTTGSGWRRSSTRSRSSGHALGRELRRRHPRSGGARPARAHLGTAPPTSRTSPSPRAPESLDDARLQEEAVTRATGLWRCHSCGELLRSWAAAERHVRDRHPPGARIECIFETTQPLPRGTGARRDHEILGDRRPAWTPPPRSRF